jgi:hypothetical protein
MCRNIKTLHNFEPPATESEIKAAAIQFVRKISGYNKPSETNAEAFDKAIEEITLSSKKFLDSLVTAAQPKNRETESKKARERNLTRFGAK